MAVNGNDVEEVIWRFMCQARLHGPHEAQRGILSCETGAALDIYQLRPRACDKTTTKIMLWG
jgi:hypothetical protein